MEAPGLNQKRFPDKNKTTDRLDFTTFAALNLS
jgi:hypothetical protein